MTKKVKIYTPTYYRYEKTRRAIDSIVESIEQSKNEVTLYIGDNDTKGPQMREWLKQLAQHPQVKVFFSDKNLGKGAMINQMHEKTGDDADYFISIDSDMLSDEHDQYNWIDELVKIMEHGPAKNFGLLSVYQKENNAHVLKEQKERTEFLGHHIMYGTFWGIAGGCVIMRNQDFIDIGRYNLVDVYSGDDALLMRNVTNKMKKLVGITEDIRLVHQANEEYEKDYQQWKIDKCHGKIKCDTKGKGFWDD